MNHPAPPRREPPQPVPAGPTPSSLLVARRPDYLAYLRRRIGRGDLAEDLFQDFAVKVVRAAVAGPPVGNLDAWMFRVLRNTLIDHYRRRDARRRAEADYTRQAGPLAEAADGAPDETRPDDEAAQAVTVALAGLRPDQAEVIRALYLRGVPRKALARDLHMEIGTLNVRAFRARRALRDALLRSGAGCGRGADAAPPVFAGGPARGRPGVARTDAGARCDA